MTQINNLIPKETVAGMFGKPGPVTNALASAVMKITGISKINSLYAPYVHLRGKDLAHQALVSLGVDVEIPESSLSFIPVSGPCIIVCNHPFGLIDGLSIIDRITDIRPDLKILTNFLLSSIKQLDEYFLPVNPFTDKPGLRSSLQGLKMAKEHLASGGVLVLFPSGEVSSDCNPEKVVKDIPWQLSMMKLIQRSGVPVVPLYFHGQNSRIFHKLGHVNPYFRTVRLVREALNKQGFTVRIRIGKPILPKEYLSFADLSLMSSWLYARTYCLEAEVSDPQTSSSAQTVPVAPHVSLEDLLTELESNSNDLLFKVDHYAVYLSRYESIPRMIREIGVCREETFRAVGEGTGTECDLDRYDEYYRHLYVWDTDANGLVGSYRLGLGYEIIPRFGLDGFYTHSLFRYSESMSGTLSATVELGRSFVVPLHQKSPLPLMLLIKGIILSASDIPQVKYFCGPVTTSGSYPVLYRSLILKYLADYHPFSSGDHLVAPPCPFEYDFGRVDPDSLLQGMTFETPEQFDRFLSRLGSGSYRMPTLIKKYIKLGAKVLGFNVDPLFNYCVDSLVLVALKDIPQSELDQFIKDVEDKDLVYKRYGTLLQD